MIGLPVNVGMETDWKIEGSDPGSPGRENLTTFGPNLLDKQGAGVS
jgi:hypothetical protein